MNRKHRLFLENAIKDPAVVGRYEAKVLRETDHWWWLGALMRSGHGRFWVGRQDGHDVVVLAHRFGYAVANGVAVLDAAPVLRHACDEALCQRPQCLIAGEDNYTNAVEWATRRHRIGSPLRDTRGRAGRARAIRSTARAGGDIAAARAAGMPQVDRDQPTLF